MPITISFVGGWETHFFLVIVELEEIGDGNDTKGDNKPSPIASNDTNNATDNRTWVVISIPHSGHGNEHVPEAIPRMLPCQ
jgi:hypothetical protein